MDRSGKLSKMRVTYPETTPSLRASTMRLFFTKLASYFYVFSRKNSSQINLSQRSGNSRGGAANLSGITFGNNNNQMMVTEKAGLGSNSGSSAKKLTPPMKTPPPAVRGLESGVSSPSMSSTLSSKRSTQVKVSEGNPKGDKQVSFGELDFSSENPRYRKRMEQEYREKRIAAGDAPDEVEKQLKAARKKSQNPPARSPIPPGF